LKPVFERALAPLVDRGFVRIVTGGAEAGGRLIGDPRVSAVHMTGAAATHDAIVFGTGDEGAANKAAGRAVLDKPVTSELGGVSPVIVLPGRWSAADLRFQAEHVATQRLHNSGFNCIASQVLILSADWEQKEDFLAGQFAAELFELLLESWLIVHEWDSCFNHCARRAWARESCLVTVPTRRPVMRATCSTECPWKYRSPTTMRSCSGSRSINSRSRSDRSLRRPFVEGSNEEVASISGTQTSARTSLRVARTA